MSRLMTRLIRSARTGQPSLGLPIFLERGRLLGIDLSTLEGLVPTPEEGVALMRLQHALGLSWYIPNAVRRSVPPELDKQEAASCLRALRPALRKSLEKLLERAEKAWINARIGVSKAGPAAAGAVKDEADGRADEAARPGRKRKQTPPPLLGSKSGSGASIASQKVSFATNRSVSFVAPHRKAISIYIDESWPRGERRGVLAGLVWLDEEPRHVLLPIPRQHLRDPGKAEVFFKKLAKCPFAAPFLFYFEPPEGKTREQAYEEMVHESLLLLLGWILPAQVQMTDEVVGVSVLCEALSGHESGTDQTAAFRGILEHEQRRNPGLFGRWTLKSLRWQKKKLGEPAQHGREFAVEQGYMAYADLIAYCAHANGKSGRASKLASFLDVESLPNRLSLSTGMVEHLLNLERTAKGEPGVFLDLLAENWHAPFMRSLAASLRQQWGGDAGRKAALLEPLSAELDRRYSAKVKEPGALARQFDLLKEIFGELPENAPLRLRLMDAGIRLQRSNYHGNPAETAGLERAYAKTRSVAMRNGLADLAAHVDLKLAARAADMFETDQALAIVEELLDEEARLSLLSQGKARSARGQYLTLSGRFEEAREEFDRALALFEEADLNAQERAAEWDQTAIYRALSAIEAEAADARALVEEVIARGGLGPEREHQFRHHLWVRLLDSDDSLAAERKGYLETMPGEFLKTHPWELIAMHRGLFAAEREDWGEAERCFHAAVEIAMEKPYGPTMRMIGLMCAAAGWHQTGREIFRENGRRILEGTWPGRQGEGRLEEALPAAQDKIVILRGALEAEPSEEALGEVLEVLSFTYR